MRRMTALVLIALLCAVPARAQTNQTSTDSHNKWLKVAIGTGMLAIGAMVAAKSSKTTTVTNPVVGTSEMSSHSTSQLVTGLVIAGAGGIVLWQGMRHPNQSSPTSSMGVAAGRQSASLFVRRSW